MLSRVEMLFKTKREADSLRRIGWDDFDLIKELVSSCLPIKRITHDVELDGDSNNNSCVRPRPTKGPFTSESCPVLWGAFASHFSKHLKNLTFDRADTNEAEMFSHLLYTFLRYGI